MTSFVNVFFQTVLYVFVALIAAGFAIYAGATIARPRFLVYPYLVLLMTPGEARKADAADADMIKAVTQAGGTLMTRGFTREFRPLEGDTLFDRIAIMGWTGPQARDQFLKGSRFKRLLAASKSQGYPFVVALDSPAVVKAAAAKPPSAP